MYCKKSYICCDKLTTNMKHRFVICLSICFLACLPLKVHADGPIEDGVYSISCTKLAGFLGLGSYHSVNPYIYYVTAEQELSDDGYWVITNTESGYTIRNQATNHLLVFTYGRDDAYYKYMTIASESLGDGSEYWNIIEGSDGAYSVQSTVATDYYWNLRSGTNMLGTYKGSNGNSDNERYVFEKKGDSPGPGPGPDPVIDPELPVDEYSPVTFPDALHVYLSDGRIEAYPLKFVEGHSEQDGKLIIETNIGWNYTYNLSEVDSVSEQKPDFATFETFKIYKRDNDQVFGTVTGEIVGDTVFVTLAAIGKRLTPTFVTSDEGAVVYVNERLQDSEGTGERLRFDKDVYYLVSRPGCKILTAEPDNKYFMHPYGRCVRVHVDWLTDRDHRRARHLPIDGRDACTNQRQRQQQLGLA